MTDETQPLPLFVYGTLKQMTTLEFAAGRTAFSARPTNEITTQDAILPGFEIFTGERNQGWPYIVPRAGKEAHGKLVFGLSEIELRRLKAYESYFDVDTDKSYPLFSPERMSVLMDGKPIECYVYVPVFENWKRPNWRNHEEAQETARLELSARRTQQCKPFEHG